MTNIILLVGLSRMKKLNDIGDETSNIILKNGIEAEKNGDFEKALELYSKGIRQTENCEKVQCRFYIQKAHLNRTIGAKKYESSEVDLSMKYFQSSIEDFRSALRIDPTDYQSHHNLGYMLGLKMFQEYDEAIRHYDMAIKLKPDDWYSFLNKGSCLTNLGQYEAALKSLKIAHKLNKGSNALIGIATVYGLMGDEENSYKYWKLAEDNGINATTMLIQRSKTMINLDPERSLEDISKLTSIFKFREWQITKNIPLDVKTARNELERVVSKEDGKYRPFALDSGTQWGLEKKHNIIVQKLLFQNIRRMNIDCVEFHRKIGSGAFAFAYLCSICDDSLKFPPFVVKLIRPSEDEKKLEKLEKKEFLQIPYHQNVAFVFCRTGIQTVDVDRLSNPEDFPTDKYIKTGMVFMKYYRKSLADYISCAEKHSQKFELDEVCNIMRGILWGVSHLHDNMIVHRDLHAGNIFVDEQYGRVWIGDFGCALDLRENNTGFRVDKDDEVLMYYSYGYDSEIDRGGCCSKLPPEIRKFDEKNGKFLDYSKSDIFSVGMLSKDLFRNAKKYQAGKKSLIFVENLLRRLIVDMIRKDFNVRVCTKRALERFQAIFRIIGNGKSVCEQCQSCKSIRYCKGCHRVLYCSRHCQKEDWKYHKRDCRMWGTKTSQK